MTISKVRALPTSVRLAREQFYFVLASVGRSWPLLVLFAVLLGWAASSAEFPTHGFAVFLTLLAASIILGASWTKRPGPHGRAYFASLAGSRARNIAIRTTSAWSVSVLAGVVLSVVCHAFGAEVDQPSWSYAAPLVGATMVVLAMSGPMATLKHSGILIGSMIWLPWLLSRVGGTMAVEPLTALIEGRLGLVTLMSGQVLVSGRLLGPEADMSPAQFIFDLPGWLTASAVWLAASLVVFAVTVSRPIEA